MSTFVAVVRYSTAPRTPRRLGYLRTFHGRRHHARRPHHHGGRRGRLKPGSGRFQEPVAILFVAGKNRIEFDKQSQIFTQQRAKVYNTRFGGAVTRGKGSRVL